MIALDLATWAETAVGGSMALALPVALLAGLVSFFSPCVVPLLPGYLSYATGLGAAEVVEGSPHRGRMLTGSLLFVIGFSFVFVSYGALIGAVGEWLFTYERQITVVLDAQGRVAASIIGELPSRTTLVEVVQDVADEQSGGAT